MFHCVKQVPFCSVGACGSYYAIKPHKHGNRTTMPAAVSKTPKLEF